MHYYITGLGCSAFARHYLRNHFCFLLLRVLRCFSSPRLPSDKSEWHSFTMPGFPIRKSWDHRLFAPPPSLSQLITSFFASQSLGIHRSLLFAFFILFFARYSCLYFHKIKINFTMLTLSYRIALLLSFSFFQYVKDLYLMHNYKFIIHN